MKGIRYILLMGCLCVMQVLGKAQGKFVRMVEEDSLRMQIVADSLRADSIRIAQIKDSLMKVREPVLRAMRKKVEGRYSFWLFPQKTEAFSTAFRSGSSAGLLQ